jgi:uncharacterized coiled-coil protein SlyX
MDDDFAEDVRPQPSGKDSQSTKDTLEADVLEETKKENHDETDQEEVLLSDVAVTAEFDYIDLDDESEVSEAEASSDASGSPKGASPPPSGVTRKKRAGDKPNKPDAAQKKNGASDGQITRALDDFDSYLDDAEEGDGDLASSNNGPSLVTDPNLSSPGAWGYDQPQVSGVFSRYEEETQESDSDEFDLFDDEESEQPRDRTLQDIVTAHEKQLRRLEKRLVYQKEVIQVVSELLVEARVVSKRELKKRLRALRDKS